jgi:hypothetical protein
MDLSTSFNLKTHDLIGIVDSSNPCPPEFLTDAEGKIVSNPTYFVWIKTNQFILSWINPNLSELVLSIAHWYVWKLIQTHVNFKIYNYSQ